MKTTPIIRSQAKWIQLTTIRLIGWGLLICVVFSAAMALGEYKREQIQHRKAVIDNLNKAIELFSPILTESLWNMNTQLTNSQMKAITHFDGVAYAILSTEDSGQLRFGSKPVDMENLFVTKSLFYNDLKNLPKLGVLSVYADLSKISQTYNQRIFHYFAFYLSITVGIAACVIFLCHMLTTQRIRHLTHTFDKITEENIKNDSLLNPSINSAIVKDEYDELFFQVHRVWKIGHNALKENQANQTTIQKIRTNYEQLKQTIKEEEETSHLQNQQDKQMLKRIIDALPYRISWRDPELLIRGANTAYLADMGISEEAQIIGTKGENITPSEQQKLYDADNASVLHSGYKQIDMTETFLFPNGESGIRVISKIPLYNEQGGVVGLLEYYLHKGRPNE